MDNSLPVQKTFTPLFPAYTSETLDSKSESGLNNTKSDWLCNSSFIPKTLEELDKRAEETKHEEDRSDDIQVDEYTEKKWSKKRKNEKKKRKHSPDSDDDKELSHGPTHKNTSKRSVISEITLTRDITLKVDHRGDPENFYYECLSNSDRARYKPFTKIPVGCKEKEKSLWFPFLPSTVKEDILRYFSKKSLKVFVKYPSPDEIFRRDTFKQTRGAMNYIPVPPDIPDQPSSKSEGFYDGISASWRKDESKKNKVDDTSTDTIQDSAIKQKTIEFNKKLLETPHNIQLWLNFVAFQDEVLNHQKTTTSDTNLVNKKVAILDKALQHNPKSVPLHVAKLNLCRSLWTVEEVMKSWDRLIFVNPNNPQVWQEHVVFVLTNLTYFNTTRVLKVFSKCLRTLSDINEGIILSHAPSEDMMYDMLDLVSNLCFVLKSCGYVERAVAIFQALIELNLFAIPSSENMSLSEKIICFEPFWDSGVTRFGEDGAVGWATTMQEKKMTYNAMVSQSDLNNEEEDILEKKLSESETWLRFEKLREFHHWLPWRPNPEYDQTEDDIDDVDRTVTFDNISKFMFNIENPEHQFLLLVHFVQFLGFDPHHYGCSHRDLAHTYLKINNFNSISKELNSELLKSDNANPFKFSDCVWTKGKIAFMKNVFLQGLPKLESKNRTLFYITNLKFLQTITDSSPIDSIDSCKKFAKNVLKLPENRNCLPLWLEYLKMEITSGAKSKAKKTAETLLTSSSLAIANNAIDMKEIWYFMRSYIDLCLNIETTCKIDAELLSPSEITWAITHIAAKEKYTPYSNEQIKPVLMLKAISGFKSAIEDELQAANMQLCYCLDPCCYSLLDCAKCYAFLQYFSQGVEAAVKVLKDTIDQVEEKYHKSNKRFLLEQLCCFHAQFLNFHLHNSTTSLRPLQLHLYDSITVYPESVQLLLMLVKLRNASSVVNPTRRFFSKLLNEHQAIKPITWVFALASELSLHCSLTERENNETDNPSETGVPSSGVKWKIRSLYEKALSSSKCCYISVLWRSYLKFEILNNDEDRARSVCVRALQNCGWSKELLMDEVMYFPDDLQQTVNFIIEKQIRIHTPVEEIQLLMEHSL